MKRRYCPATGKRQYKRHQDAAKTLSIAQKKARDGAQAPRCIYQCDECARWHLTSFEPAETRHLQAARRQQLRARRLGAQAVLKTPSVPTGQGAPE